MSESGNASSPAAATKAAPADGPCAKPYHHGDLSRALVAAGVDPTDEREMQLAQIAAWCNAHGVAEMAGFKEFEPLKEALGGEEAFVRALLSHSGIFARRPRPSHN